MEEYSLQHYLVHFLERKTDNKNQPNVKICLLIEAGTSVMNEKPTTSNDCSTLMKDKYVSLVCQLKPNDFSDSDLQQNMSERLFNAKKEITGACLWEKFQQWRKKLCTQYSPKLPKDLSTIPIGHKLRDVYKQFTLDRFKEECVSDFVSSFTLLFFTT